MSMFRVTPVPESSKERKVSFSPDIDESYRHEVVGKIKNLMEEVSNIHEKEEKALKKHQENESWEFKQKQEMELQAFLKKQREDSMTFQNGHRNQWSDLKERHTQETWKLFGAKAPANSRPSINNMWEQKSSNSNSQQSSRNSPWSPPSTSNLPSPSWPKQNPWTPSNGDNRDKPQLNYWNS